jgi:hypothetical protein
MTSATNPTPDGTRPFGWAGFVFPAPEGFKLLQVTGTHARGNIRLVDSQEIRIEVAWATVTRPRFDAQKFITKQLRRSLTAGAKREERSRGEALADVAVDPKIPALQPALLAIDAEKKLDRIVGFCPATSRVFEIVYRHGTPAQDALVRGTSLRGFIDQPIDGPMKWAFFGMSFIAPPGFVFAQAKLNLGDMQVQLLIKGSDLTGPGLLIRQIYPAKLALARQPLEGWMALWTRALAPTWRFEGCGTSGKKPPVIYHRPVAVNAERRDVPSSAGFDAIEARGGLRWLFRPFLWRAPKTTRLLMWLDPEPDRIIALQCSHRGEAVDGVLDQAARGVNWAG